LIRKLDDIGVLNGSNYIVSVRSIKQICRELFKTNYPSIKCAYLYGNYSRGEANGKSRINIAIVIHNSNKEMINEIANVLEKELHKRVDLRTFNQLKKDSDIIENILINGVKIY
jgi:predicted nucleotidyltransferase